MLKYDQFESKNNGIKKRKFINKQKKNKLSGYERRRQEIIDQHRLFVAGPSGFAKESKTYEKPHLKMEVELTPEWVLDKMSLSICADGKGFIYLYADEDTCHLIELAIITLEIPYVREELVVDCFNTIIRFELYLYSIIEKCPSIYLKMRNLNVGECIG